MNEGALSDFLYLSYISRLYETHATNRAATDVDEICALGTALLIRGFKY